MQVGYGEFVKTAIRLALDLPSSADTQLPVVEMQSLEVKHDDPMAYAALDQHYYPGTEILSYRIVPTMTGKSASLYLACCRRHLRQTHILHCKW